MAYRQTPKPGIDKLWKNADATDYVTISADHLARPRWQFMPILGLKIDFLLILQGFWDFGGDLFMLFNTPKDVVFGEI